MRAPNDTARCPRCGWPPYESIEDGCVAGDCSCRCGIYPHYSCGRPGVVCDGGPLRVEQVVTVQDARIGSREDHA